MSYDLMVFSKEAASKTRTDFMTWYRDQTKWTEGHGYDDPSNTSAELRNWFMEMIKSFPAMNGPFASKDFDDSYVSDYCIGRDVIYVAFSWSVAEEAFKKMVELAEKHSVGFFNVSSDNGEILIPVENGKLKAIDDPRIVDDNAIERQEKKPWWKFW